VHVTKDVHVTTVINNTADILRWSNNIRWTSAKPLYVQVLILTYRLPTAFANDVQEVTSIPWAVRLSWLQNAHSRSLFRRAILIPKVCQTNLVLGMRW